MSESNNNNISAIHDRLASTHTRFNRVSKRANFAFSALFILLALGAVMPVVFTVIISVSSDHSLATKGYTFLPTSLSMEAYRFLWDTRDSIFMAFTNTVINTVVGTLLGLYLMSTMAYGLSRKKFIFQKFYTMFIFIPMLFSGGLVASYLVMTQMLNINNTRWALILPLCVSSFNIIIMRTFFTAGTPDAIIESAQIDGASQYRIFFNIIIPISKPVFATIGMLLTFSFWNDWFQAQLYLNSDHTHLFPLQYVLVSIQNNLDFMTRHATEFATSGGARAIPSEAARMAMVVILVLPIAFSYPFFQKYFISGLTIGAVKG